MIGTLGALLSATVTFVIGHFVLASMPVREVLIERIGLSGFRFLFSIIAVIPTQVLGFFILDHIFGSIFIFAFTFLITLAGFKPFTKTQAQMLKNIHPSFPQWISWFVRAN